MVFVWGSLESAVLNQAAPDQRSPGTVPIRIGGSLGLECLYPGIQSRLVSRSFVLLDDTVSNRAIDNRYCTKIGRRCGLIVASI